MKAMKLTGIRQIKMENEPVPEIMTDTDVLVRMKVVGVCGSDIHYYTQGHIGTQMVKFPFTVGHEGAGVVEKTGKTVTSVKPGDRIAIEPAMPCYDCDQCRAGRHNTCRNMKFLGCPDQAEGCLSEFIVIPGKNCLPIPNNMTFEEAAICEPLSIGLYAVKQSSILGNQTAAILGFGPIGLSVLLTSKATGVKKFIVTDKIESRIEIALQNGAVYAGSPENDDVVKQALKTIPEGLDIVFECCGQQEALENGIDMLKPGGKLILVGIPEFDYWKVQADLIRRKEITIINIRRQNHCAEEAIEYVANGKAIVKPMITHRFKFNETQKAFETVAGYKDGVLKALIKFD